MEKSNFSVNIGLTNADVFELKEKIIAFIKERAESSIVKWYRPEQKQIGNGIIIGNGSVIGDPESEKLNELLDILKKVSKKEEDKKPQVLITIPLPI